MQSHISFQAGPGRSDGVCLLSLDGGGVRGLSTLYILKAIMGRLNYERKAVNLPRAKPCEIFDLIGGTSTGGLIAIMLGRLEMDVDECIVAYTRLMSEVFELKKNKFGLSWKGNVTAQYWSEKLEAAIMDILKSRGAENELFDDGKERGCKVFVCACAKETTGLTRLRSYELPGRPGLQVKPTICQAALATSAATRFFDEVHIGARVFVDGALRANNPIEEVENEASDLFCPDTGKIESAVKCFISIGTGNPGKQPIADKAWEFVSGTLVQIATETETTANKFALRWRGQFGKQYYRFNVQQGLQAVGLEEYEKGGSIETVTDEYLQEIEPLVRLKDCVQVLKHKQRKDLITDQSLSKVDSIELYNPSRFEKISREWGLVTDLELHKSIFDRMSDYDPHRAYHNIKRKQCPGTTKWILQNKSFRNWSEKAGDSCLWLSGKIGSGKTHLTATVIEHMTKSRECIVHFFFDSSRRDRLGAADVLKAFVKQMVALADALRQNCPRNVVLETVRLFRPDSYLPPDFDEIREGIFLPLNKYLVSHSEGVVYIIDGLDACGKNGWNLILGTFRKLLTEHDRCRLFVAGRENIDVESFIKPSCKLLISENDSRKDIRAFIDWKIEETSAETLLTENEALLQSVRDKLNQKAHLMILWVNLQLEVLLECTTEAEVRSALEDLPRDLPETYGRCLKKITNPNAFKILRWVSVATRPFHINELREALSIDPNTGSVREQHMLTQKEVVKCCFNLIVRDADEIVLAHHSVLQFLTQQSDTGQNPFDLESARMELGGMCIAHLTGPDYSLAVSQKQDDTMRLDISQIRIETLVPPVPLFKRILSTKKRNQPIAPINIPRPERASERFQNQTLPFYYHFAVEHWAPLTTKISSRSEYWERFRRLALQPNESYRMQPWRSPGVSMDSHFAGLLGWSITHRHLPLLELLISYEPPPRKEIYDLPLAQYQSLPPLHLLIRTGWTGSSVDEKMCWHLCKRCDMLRTDFQERTFYHHAARFGLSDVLLLPTRYMVSGTHKEKHPRQFLIEARDNKGQTPLLVAASFGHTDTVLALQTMGADIEAKTEIRPSLTDRLSESRARSRARATLGGWTPLILAAKHGHEATVRKLVEMGANILAEDDQHKTAMIHASENGHTTVVRVLFAEGKELRIDPAFTPSRCEVSALQVASLNGHAHIVRLLLIHNPDPNICGTIKETPLSYAVRFEPVDSSIVEMLLDAGADAWDIQTPPVGRRYYELSEEHSKVFNLLRAEGWTSLGRE